MLQRGIPAALQWVLPALSSAGCHLQQAAQVAESPCSTSGREFNAWHQYSRHSMQFTRHIRLKPGTVDMRNQPRRASRPYFNPDDGPEAYYYWKDLWAKKQKPPKQMHPRRPPVYLEPEEEQDLLRAAMKAGIPQHVVMGDMTKRLVPRLIAAITAAGGAIPTQPAELSERIQFLFEQERKVPGLDVQRIFKTNGFNILSWKQHEISSQLAMLQSRLFAAGVTSSAEPGVLITAAVKPALHYPFGLIDRALKVTELYQSALNVPPPADLLQHPFKASIFLNKSHRKLHRHMELTTQKHGTEIAADLYTRMPQVLLYRPSLINHKTASLAESLSMQLQQAERLVLRHPRLLTFSADKLQQRVRDLQQLLQLETDRQLQRLVSTQPSLLYKKKETLAGKLGLLQKALGDVPLQKAASVVLAQPALLTYSSDCLGGAVAALRDLSSSSPVAALSPRAAEILLAKPWLLTLGTSSNPAPEFTLTGRLQMMESLGQVLGPEWRLQLQAWASQDAPAVASVLGHSELAHRIRWLLQQQNPAGAAAAVAEHGLASLLGTGGVSAEVFDKKCCPGYLADWQQRQSSESKPAAAAAAASKATAGRRQHQDSGSDGGDVL